MTRAKEPRWGDDGLIDIPPLAFNGTHLDRWIDRLCHHAPDLDRDAARQELYSIAISHLGGHKRGPEAFTRKQVRDGLEAFLKAPCAQAALQLNGGAQDELVNSLWQMTPLAEVGPSKSVIDAFWEQRLGSTTLEKAARLALRRLEVMPKTRNGLPAKRIGRPRHYTFEWAVGELCSFWASATGTPVTAWNSIDGDYSKHSTSAGGAWVTKVLTDLEGASIAPRVRSEIAHVVRERKAQQNA